MIRIMRRLTTVGSVFASRAISQNGTSTQPDMRYGLQRSPSPIITPYTKVRAHRTTQRTTTNQNPRTSRRRSTFGLPSDSESDVDEPAIDLELELSSRSVISGENDSAPGRNRSHRREAECHTHGHGRR